MSNYKKNLQIIVVLTMLPLLMGGCSLRKMSMEGMAIGIVEKELSLASSVHVETDLIDKGKHEKMDYYIFLVKVGTENTTKVYGKIVLPSNRTIALTGRSFCVAFKVEKYGGFFSDTHYLTKPIHQCRGNFNDDDISLLKKHYGWT